jgi:hypothetical protein
MVDSAAPVLESQGVIPGRADRVLVLGPGRSGTRWLATAMGHAVGTRLVKEPDNVDANPEGRGPGRLGFGPYPLIEATDAAPQFRALWDLAFAARVPNQAGWRIAAGRAALRLPRTVRDPLLRRTAQAISALPGRAPHVVVKSIYAPFYAEWLVRNYDPKVVVIQRNPLNVISSWIDVGMHGFDLLDRPVIRERYLDPLGLAAQTGDRTPLQEAARCIGLITMVLAEHVAQHPEWLLVTHEDLCVDPAVRIREVCERAGLPWSDDVRRFLQESDRPGTGFSNVRVTREQPTRWRGRLDDQQVAEINEILGRFPTRGWIRPPIGAEDPSDAERLRSSG